MQAVLHPKHICNIKLALYSFGFLWWASLWASGIGCYLFALFMLVKALEWATQRLPPQRQKYYPFWMSSLLPSLPKPMTYELVAVLDFEIRWYVPCLPVDFYNRLALFLPYLLSYQGEFLPSYLFSILFFCTLLCTYYTTHQLYQSWFRWRVIMNLEG